MPDTAVTAAKLVDRTVDDRTVGDHTVDDQTGRENMRQLIQLRWIAVVGQIVTIAVVHFGFGFPMPLHEMSVVLLILVAFNAVSP